MNSNNKPSSHNMGIFITSKDRKSPTRKFLLDLEEKHDQIQEEIKNKLKSGEINEKQLKVHYLADLDYIYGKIIYIINQSSSDAEALQSVMQYVLSIPVEDDYYDDMSYGDFLELHSDVPIKISTLPTTHPLSLENLKDLHQTYKKFLNAYIPTVSKTPLWEFSYPKNDNGEIMTPMIQFWQDQMMEEFVDNTASNKATKDFKRSFAINGDLANIIPERLEKNAKNLCSVSLYSIESVENLQQEKDTAFIILIRTKKDKPAAVYYLNNSNHEDLCKIKMSEDQLKEFDEEMHPTSKIQFIHIYRLSEEQINSLSPIMHKLREDDILHNINKLCENLDNKELVAAWLKKCGGQNLSRFMDYAFMEKHLGEVMAIGKIVPTNINWVVKENPLTKKNEATLEYSIEIKSVVINGDVYAKHHSDIFVKLYKNPELINEHIEGFDTILTVKAELVASVEKNHNKQFVIKPKPTVLHLTSNALLNTGKQLLQSPAENPQIMEVLSPKGNITPTKK